MKIPLREIFFWNLFMVKLFGLRDWNFILLPYNYSMSFWKCVPVTSSVFLFLAKILPYSLRNFISFSEIYTFIYSSLSCLELHENFQQEIHALLAKRKFSGDVRAWVISGRYSKLIQSSQFLSIYLSIYLYIYIYIVYIQCI